MIVLHGGHVIVGDGTDLDSASVAIADGRIVGVTTKDSSGESGDTLIDVSGYTVMPGMIDIHAHTTGGDKTFGFGDEYVAFKMAQPLAASVLDSVDAARVTLDAGITTIREAALSRDYVDVFMKRAQAAGQIEAPRIRAGGPGIAMTGGHGAFPDLENTADGVQAMVRRVRQLVANGVDWVKFGSPDGPEVEGRWESEESTYEEIAAAFAEALRLRRGTMAHAMGPIGIANAVRAGAQTIEHGWYLDEENCRQMIEHDVCLVPTLGNAEDIMRKGPSLLQPWAHMMAGTLPGVRERHKMAMEMGVKIAMGSDCGGNEAHLHGANCDELVCYVGLGMSTSDAIVAGTSRPAEVLGLQNEIGTVESGKAADLVLINGDPLSDISLVLSGVVGVVQGGRVIRDDHGLLEALRVVANKPRIHTSHALLPDFRDASDKVTA